MATQAPEVFRLRTSVVHEGRQDFLCFIRSAVSDPLCMLYDFLYVLQSYLMRGAGAVIHSHGMETCMATMLVPGAKEFRVSPPSFFYVSHEIQLMHKIFFVFP
jgi:hypothetical protein